MLKIEHKTIQTSSNDTIRNVARRNTNRTIIKIELYMAVSHRDVELCNCVQKRSHIRNRIPILYGHIGIYLDNCAVRITRPGQGLQIFRNSVTFAFVIGIFRIQSHSFD